MIYSFMSCQAENTFLFRSAQICGVESNHLSGYGWRPSRCFKKICFCLFFPLLHLSYDMTVCNLLNTFLFSWFIKKQNQENFSHWSFFLYFHLKLGTRKPFSTFLILWHCCQSFSFIITSLTKDEWWNGERKSFAISV